MRPSDFSFFAMLERSSSAVISTSASTGARLKEQNSLTTSQPLPARMAETTSTKRRYGMSRTRPRRFFRGRCSSARRTSRASQLAVSCWLFLGIVNLPCPGGKDFPSGR